MWDAALCHPSLVSMVRERNRIRMDRPGDRDPWKETVSAADLPELRLDVDSLTANLMSTSSTTMVTRRYSWVLSTGDFRYTELLAPLEWYLTAAMLKWREKLSTLLWRDKSFVKVVRLTDGSAGYSDPQANRGIRGWSAIVRVEVEMHFSTADMLLDLGASLS